MLAGSELVPLYQLESMSQTRAQAKALRSRFSWVVVLAGYSPTPAEEMEGVVDVEAIPQEAPLIENSVSKTETPPPPQMRTFAEYKGRMMEIKNVYELRNWYKKHFYEMEHTLSHEEFEQITALKDTLKEKLGDF